MHLKLNLMSYFSLGKMLSHRKLSYNLNILLNLAMWINGMTADAIHELLHFDNKLQHYKAKNEIKICSGVNWMYHFARTRNVFVVILTTLIILYDLFSWPLASLKGNYYFPELLSLGSSRHHASTLTWKLKLD